MAKTKKEYVPREEAVKRAVSFLRGVIDNSYPKCEKPIRKVCAEHKVSTNYPKVLEELGYIERWGNGHDKKYRFKRKEVELLNDIAVKMLHKHNEMFVRKYTHPTEHVNEEKIDAQAALDTATNMREVSEKTKPPVIEESFDFDENREEYRDKLRRLQQEQLNRKPTQAEIGAKVHEVIQDSYKPKFKIWDMSVEHPEIKTAIVLQTSTKIKIFGLTIFEIEKA